RGHVRREPDPAPLPALRPRCSADRSRCSAGGVLEGWYQGGGLPVPQLRLPAYRARPHYPPRFSGDRGRRWLGRLLVRGRLVLGGRLVGRRGRVRGWRKRRGRRQWGLVTMGSRTAELDAPLNRLVSALRDNCGDELRAVVLYGSAAANDFVEGGSDVNL